MDKNVVATLRFDVFAGAISRVERYVEKKDLSLISSHILLVNKDRNSYNLFGSNYDISIEIKNLLGDMLIDYILLPHKSIKDFLAKAKKVGYTSRVNISEIFYRNNIEYRTIEALDNSREKVISLDVKMYNLKNYLSDIYIPQIKGNIKSYFRGSMPLLLKSLEFGAKRVDIKQPKIELHGVYISHALYGKSEVVATDTRICYKNEIANSVNFEGSDEVIILHKNTISNLLKEKSKFIGIDVVMDSNNDLRYIKIIGDDVDIYTLNIGGKFLDYNSVFPQETKEFANINTDDLNKALAICDDIVNYSDGIVYDSDYDGNNKISIALKSDYKGKFAYKKKYLELILESLKEFRVGDNDKTTTFKASRRYFTNDGFNITDEAGWVNVATVFSSGDYTEIVMPFIK